MIEAFSLALLYIGIGFGFVAASGPRGTIADLLFVALWPMYLVIFLVTGR